MKKFQPDRKDIFINTDWGIPEDRIPKEKAKNQDLLLFKKRWVTKEEKKILGKQYIAYISIRMISVSHIISIGTGMIVAALVPLNNDTKFVLLFCGVIGFVASIGLWHFKQWGRWLATLFWGTIGLLSFPTPVIVMYYLHNKTARQIFKSV
ncbi:MAG: hypothetical protein D4R56_07045 [Deltaproteobacteria bacterium]|nr:MAG: hypothetical protein D4R56_07045 [Deltaproteobacteria bacterium]